MDERRKKRDESTSRDGKKESYYKILADTLRAAGFDVRRERLKQGPGWRVSSGHCRTDSRKMVFVDSRMVIDEQISFLAAEVARAKLSVDSQSAAKLPEAVRNLCQSALPSEPVVVGA